LQQTQMESWKPIGSLKDKKEEVEEEEEKE
jgi:hypothetical protein